MSPLTVAVDRTCRGAVSIRNYGVSVGSFSNAQTCASRCGRGRASPISIARLRVDQRRPREFDSGRSSLHVCVHSSGEAISHSFRVLCCACLPDMHGGGGD